MHHLFYRYITISLLLSSVFISSYADQTAIQAANNSAAVSFQFGQEKLSYGDNPDNFTLFPATGKPLALNTAITKTFGSLYTQLNMSYFTSTLQYDAPNSNYSNAESNIQTLGGRLGWTWAPISKLSFTPYLSAAYSYQQLDTGGISVPQFDPQYVWKGETQIFQSFPVGLGLLTQFSPIDKWVLSFDVTYGVNLFTTTNANIPVTFVGSPSYDAIVYQTANLSNRPFWQLALTSNYQITPRLQALVGVQLLQSNFGSGHTTPSLNFQVPSQQQTATLYTLGLAYSLDDLTLIPSGDDFDSSYSDILYAVNNQASVSGGAIIQDYREVPPGGNGSEYIDRQTGNIPVFIASLSHTWDRIYTQLNLSEAFGNSSYIGQLTDGTPYDTVTHNTIADISGRLGYGFQPTQKSLIIPYITTGYHRWLRNTQGIEENGFNVDGYPETYSHNWVGAGFLAENAVNSHIVMSLDADAGATFNAMMTTWGPEQVDQSSIETFRGTFNLKPEFYYRAGLGVDYNFTGNWHMLGKIDYLHFAYGASPVNSLGFYEPDSLTNEFIPSLGIGYSFK